MSVYERLLLAAMMDAAVGGGVVLLSILFRLHVWPGVVAAFFLFLPYWYWSVGRLGGAR